MHRQYLPELHDGGDLAAANLLNLRRSAELDLLSVLAADPAKLIPVFALAGGGFDLFTDDDTAAIGIGLRHAADKKQGQAFAFNCAKFLLKHQGCWSDGRHPGFGFEWTEPRLLILFESWFPYPAAAMDRTERLISLHRRLRDAEDLSHRLKLVLAETSGDVQWRYQYQREGVA